MFLSFFSGVSPFVFEALGGRTLDSKSSDISSKRVSAYDNALIFVISLMHLLTDFPNKVYLFFSGFVSWKYFSPKKSAALSS